MIISGSNCQLCNIRMYKVKGWVCSISDYHVNVLLTTLIENVQKIEAENNEIRL